MNEQKELTVEEYLKVLEEKGVDAAKQLVVESFGEEGKEGFKEEAFIKFSEAAIAEMIERNNKWVADIREAQSEEAVEVTEEEAKDEAES